MRLKWKRPNKTLLCKQYNKDITTFFTTETNYACH